MRKILALFFTATISFYASGQVTTSTDTLIAIGNLISKSDDNTQNFKINGYCISKYRILKIFQASASSDTVSVAYTCNSFPNFLPKVAMLKLLKFNGKKDIPNCYIAIDIKEFTEKSITETKDSFVEVTTIGVFDGKIINKFGFRINEYCISINDITEFQVNVLKGRKVMVTGKLKIVKGVESKNIQSSLENKKYIVEPKFTIIYD